MNNRTENKLQREIAKLNDSEALSLQNYINELLNSRKAKIPEVAANDELITTLADKRENQCARQVIEWEKTRRRNFYRAA
jgi:hypothetical protein